MSELFEKIIGTGAMFPVVLEEARDSSGNIILEDGGPKKGWYPIKGDIKLIEQNMKNIIHTLIGSRLRGEDFGSRVHEMLEEPNTRVTTFLTSKFVTESIIKWEPRVKQVKVTTESLNHKLNIILTYKLENDPSQQENETSITYNI